VGEDFPSMQHRLREAMRVELNGDERGALGEEAQRHLKALGYIE
jgi:hypothetical protein